MSTVDDVTALALAAGGGDRAALSEFIRATQAEVWRFVARLAGRQAADDLTQETYLRVLGALADFKGRSSARTWLLAIARRAVADQFRRQAARPLTIPVDWTRVEGEFGGRGAAPSDPLGEMHLEELLGELSLALARQSEAPAPSRVGCVRAHYAGRPGPADRGAGPTTDRTTS